MSRSRSTRWVLAAVAASSAVAWHPVAARCRAPRVRRFADAVPETETPEAETAAPDAPPETEASILAAAEALMAEAHAAQGLATPSERAEAVGDALDEFDWEAHLGRVEADDEARRTEAAEAERDALGIYEADDLAALAAPILVDDEPPFLKPRWDEVDPGAYDYRNPPASAGATWSNIHVKSDWFQFEDGERLKTEEGWDRFDHRAYNVTNNLFDPTRDFRYGPIDLDVVEAIQPALSILGGLCAVLEASAGVVRLKYDGQAKNRVGIEAYAEGLVRDLYPAMTAFGFEARFVSDVLDGGNDQHCDGWRS